MSTQVTFVVGLGGSAVLTRCDDHLTRHALSPSDLTEWANVFRLGPGRYVAQASCNGCVQLTMIHRVTGNRALRAQSRLTWGLALSLAISLLVIAYLGSRLLEAPCR